MAVQKEIPICTFKPLRCDDAVSTDSRLSAHLEIANINGSGRRNFNHDIPFNSLFLTAWALLLKYYLATDLISFASSGIRCAASIATEHEDNKFCSNPYDKGAVEDLIHSLEIADCDPISDIFKRVQEPVTQRPFDSALLPCINTLLLYRQCAKATIPSKMMGMSDADPGIARQMDICLTVTNNRGVLSLDIGLCASKFSQPLAQRLLHTYRHILDLISTGCAGQTVGSLDLLTRHDLNQICEWNANVPLCHNTCLHSIFEEQARRRPQAPAVCSWDGNLTYAELNALSTKLAHYLSRLGVGPEIFVPYGFEKSVYAVVATLAVLKAGGAFVPLDSSHPEDRLKLIISRVEAQLILASSNTAPAFERLFSNVLIVDQKFLDSLPEEEHNPYSTVSPNNSAFVLFTSGSTGEPKGLVQEHASVCTVNEAYQESLFINEESRVLNFAAYTFDVSTVDVFTTLSQGGCVCIPSEEDRLNDIVRVINEFRVNWIDLTPSFAMASIPHPGDIPTLKTLILAGEEVKREHVAHFVGRIHRVINCYGPAEAGGCLAHAYQNASSLPQTVGCALKSASCWIVDVKNPGRLAPIGAIGELVVEGPTLAREYLKDPSRTGAAFFCRPGWRLGEVNGPLRRFYRTGDLVRYRPDGLINFVGRQDTQVKVRGQRIELTEIEQHLADDRTIKRCVIELPPSGVYAKRLVAVVEPHFRHDCGSLHASSSLGLLPAQVLRENGFSLNDSTKLLAKRVPTYMMPSVWLVVAGLPLTDSRKVDRRRVRDWLTNFSIFDNPLAAADISRIPLIPLGNPLALDISHKVSTIIANGNSQVLVTLNGRNFDLAAAGIDSVQIVTLSKWIQDEYRLKLSMGQLTCPGLTIGQLARVVAAFRDGKEPEKLPFEELNILDEVNILSKRFSKPRSGIPKHFIAVPPVSTVLLTGGTGFLGNEILHQLLCNPGIKKVFVHVRANSVQHGRERVVAAATRAKWWSASFDHRLEIWPGDLGRPKLGLSDAQWDRLTGNTPTEIPIDAVIHNGAAVQWNLGYQSLRASNTISTVQLLEAVAERRSCGRFMYVSGGQVLTTGADDENLMAAQGVHLTGYAQTKVVSELLVKRFAESKEGRGHIVRVVKPSYIIGDTQRGMGNRDDYLWRLTKSVIELGTYSGDGRNGWLFVSDVVTVAKTVCQICSTKSTTPKLVKILDGLTMQHFWNLLTQDFGYKLRAMDGVEWWYLLRSHVERSGSQHCLWALQDILAAETGEIASTATVPTAEMIARSSGILRAVRSNVQYLRDHIRFLPPVSSRLAKL
ncbi:hypothetical protein B7463_g11356, partial [Scytalidium lignicola]